MNVVREIASRRIAIVVCGVALGLTASAFAPPSSSRTLAQPSERSATIADAQRVGSAFAAVAARVAPSVVSIRVDAVLSEEDISPLLRWMLQDLPPDTVIAAGASGFVISEDGAILTNRHVVSRAARIRVRLADGRVLPARIVGTDRATDLAVIRVPARGLEPLRFADMREHQVGDWVVAVGSPYGFDATVTTGVVSALGRSGLGMSELEDYVQTDAVIHPGSSGGPLVDLDGAVVGVTTIVLRPAPGVSFAVSADLARDVAQQLLEHGRIRRPWIGVEHQDLTPELASALGAPEDRGGAIVNALDAESPAARAGVELGDVIVAVDGAPVERSVDLTRHLLRHPIDDDITLGVLRRGQEQRIALRAIARAAEEDEERPSATRTRARPRSRDLGIELLALTPELAEQVGYEGRDGAIVGGVREAGPAYHAGLRPGDVIVDADRRTVRTVEDLGRALSDGTALLRVVRGDHAFYTVLGERS
ncbi:trypsin-like peptidase domain-containing protein [Sandaracinus amylolyticus]|uniref:Outer membrane stress sensor protease DegS n=1 Tax=Sandaracinus amylolyticus TaxID=927083 RepID=A0A0F6VZA2_9BACT|nr:trypsin-like peptidase domain-containing protein [Sandaracinus amylolyticus]AKF03430.1 Outer membrane stress sensor protease DegS [Sandaracinus amylolyticus]